MKSTQRSGRAAFTLIELMAVITIIVILAGLVVTGMGFVTERQAKEKARVQIALISKALEEYKLDNGNYPPTDSKDGLGTSASTLYESLFFEGYEYAKLTKNGGASPDPWKKTVKNIEVLKSTKIYLPDFDPTSTKQGWVNLVTGAVAVPPGSTVIRDPWGNEYRYRSAFFGATPNDDTQNPDFDLWSAGKDGKSKPATAGDKTNNDDIRNF